MKRTHCAACGRALEPQVRGRPRKYCHVCHPPNAGARIWRELNPDRVVAHNLARRQKVMTRACVICGEEFETRSAIARICGSSKCKYRRADPEKRRIRESAREVRRGNRRGSVMRDAQPNDPALAVTSAQIKQLLASAKSCALCRKRLSSKKGHPRKKHVDHIVPLAAGGSHTLENLRVLCATCNLSRPHDASDVEKESLWARV